MKLLTIIDNFYTQTLRGFLAKYSYEQGITGYLGLSFLSGALLALRRIAINVWDIASNSLLVRIIGACFCFVWENIMKLVGFCTSIVSGLAGKAFSYGFEFASGPGKEFTINHIIPTLKAEATHLKDKPIMTAIGCALFLASASDLFNLVFKHNQDQTKKYDYFDKSLLVFNGAMYGSVMCFSAISLITPAYKVDTNKACILLTGIYFFNKFTQSSVESRARN